MSKPNNTFLSVRAASALIGYIWVHNLVISAPLLFWIDVRDDSCYYVHISYQVVAIYTYATTAVNYFLPLLITWSAYVGIIIKMNTYKKNVCFSFVSLYIGLNFVTFKINKKVGIKNTKTGSRDVQNNTIIMIDISLKEFKLCI